jgi:UV DNA damage repair endonuclease
MKELIKEWEEKRKQYEDTCQTIKNFEKRREDISKIMKDLDKQIVERAGIKNNDKGYYSIDGELYVVTQYGVYHEVVKIL